MYLSPCLAGGVRLCECLQFMCLPLEEFICLTVWLQFICLPLLQFTRLPVWRVVSGPVAVSNSFVSPYSNSFVFQSGRCYQYIWVSPIHLSPLIAIHLSPNLAGGVRLCGCLQFICFPL